MIYRFGPFELDRQAYTLHRAGSAVHLRPKLYDVLVYLIEHRERVVTNQELLDAVWAPEHVTPSVVHWTISRLRMALEQSKGSQEPIETIPRRGYRFSGSLSIATETERNAAPEPAAAAARSSGVEFVGRESVMQVLERGLASARGGAGALYLLIGEPGIGKSCCALEFASRWASEGSAWFGICEHGPSAPLLWPWLQILRSCGERELPGSPLHREVQALLAALRSDGSDGDVRSAGPRTTALLERMRELILRMAESRPCVFVLDDLCDADESSLDLLSMLVPRLPTSKLLVVATLRQLSLDLKDVPHHPRLEWIRSRAHCVELPPWSREEVVTFVTRSLPGTDAEELAELVWRRSGGNPLFAQELVRFELVHGAASAVSRSSRPLAKYAVPAAVQDLVRRRLQQLSSETLAALSAASVIGRTFDLALLGRVVQQPAAALLAGLEPATRLGVVERTERASEYAFRHELIREVVYTELTGGELSSLHRAVGAALEDPAFGPVSASALAWHFYCAAPIGAAAQAVRYAMRAARGARRIGAYSDEARYCEWALEAQAFCHEFDAEERCEVLLALGQARMELGEETVARRHLLRAVEIAQARNLPRILAESALALRSSMLLPYRADPQARRALEEAQRTLSESEQALRARVAATLSSFPPYSYEPEQRDQLIAQGRALAQESGSDGALIDVLRASCVAAKDPSQVEERIAQARQLETVAARAGARDALLEAQFHRYTGLLQAGQGADANAVLDELLQAIGRRSWTGGGWLVRHLDARRDFLAGRFEQALARYHKLRPRKFQPQSDFMEFHDLVGVALVHLERGTTAEYWPSFVGAIPLWRRRSVGLGALSARMLIAQGRLEEARSDLEQLGTEALRRPFKGAGKVATLAHFALAASALTDLEGCRVAHEELLPHAELHALNNLWYSLGSVAHYLGVTAETLGELADARAHFEMALESNSACGYRPYAAWSRFGLARVLPRTGGPSARRQSELLFEDCEKEARDLDMGALLGALENREPLR